MGKKKNKQLIRPWCWYCEREFEDEKVLMQHQKAKHFKCSMCPRRLNTAGGLAVHIQQVHKLEPENLPRIENALPGRDGYEVEIFGMEGIPAPDVADFKRRKEIELGLAAGTISQPQAKRPKIDNRVIPEHELRRQLEEHKALMGLNNPEPPKQQESVSVYSAPQTYAAPPVPLPPNMTPVIPNPATYAPIPPMGAAPFVPPFASGIPPTGPAFPLPPGVPSGVIPPGGFPPGALPPGVIPPGAIPPGAIPPGAVPPFTAPGTGDSEVHRPVVTRQPVLILPDPSRSQTNPEFKKQTDLKFNDANFSPEEHRAVHPKYFYPKIEMQPAAIHEESRGKKRARAEDFL